MASKIISCEALVNLSMIFKIISFFNQIKKADSLKLKADGYEQTSLMFHTSNYQRQLLLFDSLNDGGDFIAERTGISLPTEIANTQTKRAEF